MARKPIPELPESLAKLVEKTFPDGVVEEFDESESYFFSIRESIRADLHRIRGVAAFWESADPFEKYNHSAWDDDDDDFGESPPEDFQSYHVFFLAPVGEEFVSEEETEGYAEPDPLDEDEDAVEPEEATYSGTRRDGYVLGVSLLARVAAISWSSMASFEDGSEYFPDVYSQEACEPGEKPSEPPLSKTEPYSKDGIKKMERLRNAIVAVLKKHRIRLIEDEELALCVPRLRASEEVFIGKPVSVFEAFFFHGV